MSKFVTDIPLYGTPQQGNDTQMLPMNLPPKTNQQMNMTALSAGSGSNSVHMDQQGLWVGSNSFSLARMRIDMNGNMIWRDDDNNRMFIGKTDT